MGPAPGWRRLSPDPPRPQVRPIAWEPLLRLLRDRILAVAAGRAWTRVGLDGAGAARPEHLGRDLVPLLRAAGRAAYHVDLADFVRPASVRLERGHTDPDAYYEQWYDLAALGREVLAPLRPCGTGRFLPRWWDQGRDRSARAGYRCLPEGGVLLLSGPLLLGAGLDLDLTVHCAQSAAALARRTPADQAWTLPAFDRYQREVDPAALADVVLRLDDPARPALVLDPG